jgi:threonine dehydrogenase-like Zn-dependent dehydrogenase
MHALKAEMLGAGRLIAIDVFPERARAARPDVALDAAADHAAAVRDATDGYGADVVVHCTGVASTFPEALALVRPGGTVIEAGTFVDMGDVAINPSRDICTKSVTVIGIGGETLPQYAPALKLLERHAERIAPLVTHRVGLDDVGRALELAQSPAALKVLVTPRLQGETL